MKSTLKKFLVFTPAAMMLASTMVPVTASSAVAAERCQSHDLHSVDDQYSAAFQFCMKAAPREVTVSIQYFKCYKRGFFNIWKRHTCSSSSPVKVTKNGLSSFHRVYDLESRTTDEAGAGWTLRLPGCESADPNDLFKASWELPWVYFHGEKGVNFNPGAFHSGVRC